MIQTAERMDRKIMPKVSIIVPTYNVQEYVRECMDSLLRQTLQDIEIICVNDGSTDGSGEILESYARQDSRIKVLNKENTGYGASMNLGIREASGEYIGIVEPDDFVEPEMYEELYQKAEAFQLDWVKGNFQVFTGSGEGRRSSVVRVNLRGADGIYYKILHPQKYPELIVYDDFHWKGIYRKAFLEKNHIVFNETPGAAYQDNGFKYQTICMSEKVMYIDKAYYWYRRDNPSASTYSMKGLELMYGEYQFIKDFMDRNPERTRVFRTVYYKKLYLQLCDQLSKLLDKEWEDMQAGEILELYRKELRSGFEQGDLSGRQVEDWIWYGMKLFIRYPRSFYEQRKIQEEIRIERYHEWIDNLKDKKVVLVCGGIKARQVINFVDTNHFNPIAAVCDNDEKKWGRMLYQYAIMPTAQAAKEYADGYFLIAKTGNTQELQEQLMKLGIPEENIESISIGLDNFGSLKCVV